VLGPSSGTGHGEMGRWRRNGSAACSDFSDGRAKRGKGLGNMTSGRENVSTQMVVLWSQWGNSAMYDVNIYSRRSDNENIVVSIYNDSRNAENMTVFRYSLCSPSINITA